MDQVVGYVVAVVVLLLTASYVIFTLFSRRRRRQKSESCDDTDKSQSDSEVGDNGDIVSNCGRPPHAEFADSEDITSGDLKQGDEVAVQLEAPISLTNSIHRRMTLYA